MSFSKIALKNFGKVTRHKQVGCRFAQLFPVIIGCVVGRYITLVVELLIPEDPWDFKFLNELKHICRIITSWAATEDSRSGAGDE